jgi:hypothetical protein
MKEIPTVGSSFFRSFPSDRIPRRRRRLMYIALFTVAIPVNYTTEFLERYGAAKYFPMLYLYKNHYPMVQNNPKRQT